MTTVVAREPYTVLELRLLCAQAGESLSPRDASGRSLRSPVLSDSVFSQVPPMLAWLVVLIKKVGWLRDLPMRLIKWYRYYS